MRARAAVVSSLLATSVLAAPVRWFTLDTPRALAGAASRGVAVLPDGTLQVLPPLNSVAEFEEPLGLALAVTPQGVAFVGTGHPARVWKVEGSRKTLVGEVPADQVTALALDSTGRLYVATALPALLLEMKEGPTPALGEIARLDAGSIWDLTFWRGSLWAAAGDPGRVLRLGTAGWEVAFDVPDRHARCLEAGDEQLYVGTSGKGMLLRWGGGGAPVVVYDSEFTEIADLQRGDDGWLYATGLTGDPTLGTPAKVEGEPTVTVSESSSSTPQTNKGPATSEIVRVYPTGAAVPVHRFSRQVAGPLAWSGTGLVIGTTVEGGLWQLVDGGAAQLDTVDASAISRIDASGDWVLTVGPVTLLRRQGTPRGTFISPPLDAGQPAEWGRATLEGQLPPGRGCRQSFRSGPTGEPGEAWSEWSPTLPCGEVRVAAPAARYLQARVELEAISSRAPRVGRLAIAYRQINLPPIIKELVTHPPGEVFLKGPPPSERVVDVQHPDLAGIFTVLDEEDQQRQQSLGRKYYRVGYQPLSWRAEDPNGDPLRFSLEVQRQHSDAWWVVRQNLDTLTLALDTTALADGWYRFRLTASDSEANPDAPASEQALSGWVTVDNTPPRLHARREGAEWLVEVEDALSPIAILEYNRDAQGWHRAACEDGLLDSRREVMRLPVMPGAHVLTVRAVDDHHNSATIALEER